MDHPHTLSDAIPLAPELLGEDEDVDHSHLLDPSLTTSSALEANSTLQNNQDHTADSLLDPSLSDKWDDFTSSAADFYPPSLPTDTYPSHDMDLESKLHIGVGIGGPIGVGVAPVNTNLNTSSIDVGSPTLNESDTVNGKRKRARRDPANPSGSMRKRPSTQQDPNDPNAHLLLPSNLQGRAIEYALHPMEDTRHGPVFIHPPPGSIQACVRCHGIKRKCEALGWRLKSGQEMDGQDGMGQGGVVWEKPRCSGCEKADVPCVFELAAASSGLVHSLRSEASALNNELAGARQRIQELEISLAVSQTE